MLEDVQRSTPASDYAGSAVPRLVVCLLFLLALLAIAGCGSSRSVPSAPVRLALDFTPNPAHAPIYLAVSDRYNHRYGIRLQIRAPGNGPDALKLLLSGRADIGRAGHQ